MEYPNRLGEERIFPNGDVVRIIKYNNSQDIDVLFVKQNIIVKKRRYHNFKIMNIKSREEKKFRNTAYIGNGDNKSQYNNVKCKIYKKWKSMIERCYCMDIVSYTYVEVCKDWHNFQKFAEWYRENYNPKIMGNWHLDKDILSDEGKIYSPEYCCFVPGEINMSFCRKKKQNIILPSGVFLVHGKYFRSVLVKNGKNIYLGYFKNEIEAFKEYKKEKEKHIKEMAQKYKSVLPKKTFNALINYSVKE